MNSDGTEIDLITGKIPPMIAENGHPLLPVVCARMGSTRLPGKLMEDLGGEPMLTRVLRRIQWPGIVAMPECERSGPLDAVAMFEGWATAFGSERDVLLRIIKAAERTDAKNILRITPDNPLVDVDVTIETWKEFKDSGADYCAMAKLPAGMMVEIISLKALDRLYMLIEALIDDAKVRAKFLEHPTLGFHRLLTANHFHVHIFDAPERWQRPYRLTVDEPADLKFMQWIYKALGPVATLDEVIEYLDANPEIARSNAHVQQVATVGIEYKEEENVGNRAQNPVTADRK